MHWSEIWEGQSAGSRIIRTALTPASWLYSIGWQSYLALYQLGFKRAAEPHVPVICVGNLAVGGSGKSPVVRYLCELLTDLGFSPVVSCSAYGSPSEEAARIAPEGPLDPLQWGDEPALLRDWIPNLSLIVGRRRVLAAQLCAEAFPLSVMLMDDGFQHLPLKKHLTLLLDRAGKRNRACLPAGPYREPYRNRERADLTLPGRFSVTYSDLEFSPHAPSEANVLCALGSPQGFLQSIRTAQIRILEARLLADHDTLQKGNLFEGLDPAVALLVTEKDWIKLSTRSDIGNRKIVVAKRKARIEPEAEFREWISNRLNEYKKQPTSQ